MPYLFSSFRPQSSTHTHSLTPTLTQDRFGALFFMLLFLALLSLSSLPVWRDEALLFMRERASGVYGTAAYFTSVVLWDVLPLRVLPPGLFTAVSYGMIGLRASGGAVAGHWLVLVVANITAAAANMSIGAAVGSVALANMVGRRVGGRGFMGSWVIVDTRAQGWTTDTSTSNVLPSSAVLSLPWPVTYSAARVLHSGGLVLVAPVRSP